MTTKPETKTCSRCKGKGFLSGHIVVYAGAPGTCYKCAGRGWVYADKFIEAFGTKGVFYGATIESRFETVKCIGRGDLARVRADSFSDTTITEITEEQARRFFAKYGERHSIKREERVLSRDARAVLLYGNAASVEQDEAKRAAYIEQARKFADKILQEAA
jgi:hypothetical protein